MYLSTDVILTQYIQQFYYTVPRTSTEKFSQYSKMLEYVISDQNGINKIYLWLNEK